ATDPDRSLSRLPMLTEAERQQLLVAGNPAAAPHKQQRCIPEIFEEHVQRAPEAIAVVCGEERLTYGELNRRANRLARYLQKHGVGLEARVGVCLERSAEMMVALLGILKAGGAYLPLDPSYPPERLE